MILGVDAGFSRSRGFGAKLIMSTTEAFWCHTFIRFRFSDRQSRTFESRISSGGFNESNPFDYDLHYLKEAGVETNVEAVCVVPLLDDPGDPRLPIALTLCKQWSGAKSYPLFQLAAIWLSRRYGLPVPQSSEKLICSEALAVIAFELGVDLRDKWHPNFDSVTPGSAWNNLMAIRAGYGDHVVRKKEIKLCGAGYSKYYSLRPRRP